MQDVLICCADALFSLSIFSHCKLFHLSIAAMPLSSSSTTVYRFIIFLIPLQRLVVSSATHNRRILHQPFVPQDSPPPNLPFSSLPTSNYPFTTSTPPDTPFFPFYPSSPPPPPPFPASFPANLSSVVLPYASKSKRASYKLIAAAVAAAAAALVLVSIALLLHFRKRRTRDCTDTKTRSSACSSRIDFAVSGQPDLQRPSQRSSEFLYLGTLVNSHSDIGTDHRQQNLLADSSALNSRKSNSPELRPLPLLSRQTVRDNHGNVELGASGDDNGEEYFYSPKGSLVGIESLIGTGSASRRDFSVIELENFGGLCSSSSYSSSKSSTSGSPNRSLSRSISPPASLSPKSFSLKSPELVADQDAPLRSPPPPPPPVSFLRVPLVEVKESQSLSLSPRLSTSPPSSTSPVRVYSRSKDTSPRISNSLDGNLDSSQLNTSLGRKKVPPPPPPLPPPLSSKQWGSPRTPIPQVRRLVSEPPVLVPPLRPVSVESPSLILPIQLPNILETDRKNGKALESNGNADDNEDVYKLKLKPLHWDKVRASSDHEMVWDQLQSSSFRLNEEMFETLFVAKAPIPTPKEAPRWSVLPLPTQGNRILHPKKSQNIAILLKALNVTVDEVCDALVEGNADSLGTELLESLLKMAPSKEEEQNLKEYKDDSPLKLGTAEKFLKDVLEIPFAFKRVEALLHVSNFESEIEYLKNSFQTLEVACEELRNSRMFLKLLEAVLKTGNRMNIGTNRGDAQAFKLDTLLKLVDIKGADGKTTLLHFVVQEIIRSEGARIHSTDQNTGSSVNDDLKCRKLGLQVVSSLCSELNNVKKAAVMDSEVLHSDVLKLSNGIGNIAEVVCLVETAGLKEKTEFSLSMNKFIRMSEEGMIRIQAQESVALSLVKEITEYFHGNSSKEEAHPFRIFMVVRDFLKVLDSVCKEVGSINERTMINCAHKFPVPVNPNLQQTSSGFPGRLPYDSSNNECEDI